MQNDNLQDEKTSSAQNPSHSSFLRVFEDTLVISMMSHVHCQAPGKSNLETLFYMGIRMFSTK